MSRHLLTRYKAKYFVIGSIFTVLLSSTWGFSAKYREDEKELRRMREEISVSADVRRVKRFYLAKNPKLWDSLANEMATATVQACSAYRVPLEIQVGVNVRESEAFPFAVSRTGAKGMGQVDFSAWRDELPRGGNPFEPQCNQEATAYVLSKNIRRYGLRKGLEMYNLGEGNYKKGRRNRRYVSEVFALSSEFRYQN